MRKIKPGRTTLRFQGRIPRQMIFQFFIANRHSSSLLLRENSSFCRISPTFIVPALPFPAYSSSRRLLTFDMLLDGLHGVNMFFPICVDMQLSFTLPTRPLSELSEHNGDAVEPPTSPTLISSRTIGPCKCRDRKSGGSGAMSRSGKQQVMNVLSRSGRANMSSEERCSGYGCASLSPLSHHGHQRCHKLRPSSQRSIINLQNIIRGTLNEKRHRVATAACCY